MATQRQTEANRLNAQRSTGPRTPEGKIAVRFNALQHGIDARVLVIPGESQDELDALATGYFHHYQPRIPVACYLVDTLVHCDWMRRRLMRLQANILRSLSGEESSDIFARADRAALGSAPLDRVFRQLNALERQYFRALTELRRLGLEPSAGEIGFVPSETEEPAEVGQVANLPEVNPEPPRSQIGFVPQDAAQPGQVEQPSPAGQTPSTAAPQGQPANRPGICPRPRQKEHGLLGVP